MTGERKSYLVIKSGAEEIYAEGTWPDWKEHVKRMTGIAPSKDHYYITEFCIGFTNAERSLDIKQRHATKVEGYTYEYIIGHLAEVSLSINPTTINILEKIIQEAKQSGERK